MRVHDIDLYRHIQIVLHLKHQKFSLKLHLTNSKGSYFLIRLATFRALQPLATALYIMYGHSGDITYIMYGHSVSLFTTY